jgi:hypothetical protein
MLSQWGACSDHADISHLWGKRIVYFQMNTVSTFILIEIFSNLQKKPCFE